MNEQDYLGQFSVVQEWKRCYAKQPEKVEDWREFRQSITYDGDGGVGFTYVERHGRESLLNEQSVTIDADFLWQALPSIIRALEEERRENIKDELKNDQVPR